MRVVRVSSGYDVFDNKDTEYYYIMEVSWLRERLWVVEKYKGVNSFGKPKIYKRQTQWTFETILKALSSKEQLLLDIIEEFEGTKKVDLVTLFTPKEHDMSHYQTVRWFPFFRGIWMSRNEKHVRDIDGHNILEDYPEYFI